MRKINLTPYTVQITKPNGTTEIVPYDIIKSIEAVTLAPTQELNSIQLLERARILQKFKKAKNTILIEEQEYNLIAQAFNKFKGFGLNEVELCKRILEAKTVNVEEKQK